MKALALLQFISFTWLAKDRFEKQLLFGHDQISGEREKFASWGRINLQELREHKENKNRRKGKRVKNIKINAKWL